MEQSWENWSLQMELDHDDDDDFLEQCHIDIDDLLREYILQQPHDISSETESQISIHHSSDAQNNFNNTNSDEIIGFNTPGKRPRPSSPLRTYILSFENSTIIPSAATTEPKSLLSSKKRTLQENKKLEPKPIERTSQGGKKSRNDPMDHIMAERKRRQDLTERFIALAATIPGLKKTDKTSILKEAINYVKQLKERVSELEKRNNKGGQKPIIFIKKADLCANNDDTRSTTITTSCETRSEDNCCRSSELLPDVEARVLENEVLIKIHCEKENGVEFKILDHLESNLHLCVTGSSAFSFGNSTLGITIIAQMGNAYKMTVTDLVRNLREALLHHTLQC